MAATLSYFSSGPVPPGTTIMVNGAGFPRQTFLVLSWAGTTFSSKFRSDKNGSFGVNFTIPASTADGTYVLRALDHSSNLVYASVNVPVQAAVSPPASVPGAPTSLTVAVNSNVATLTWVAPASNGGSAITGYKIYRNSVEVATLGVVLTWQNTGLVNGISYSFQVAAINAIGVGPKSNAVSVTPSNLIWGLIGNDGTKLTAERNAGINTKLFELSWSSYETADNTYNSSYISTKQSELTALRNAGFNVILSMGVQTAPTWVFSLPNALYVNQYGENYTETAHGHGRANAIWNPTIRTKMGEYIAKVLTDFGTDFYAIRVGGSRYGELGYPVNTWNGKNNTYWAYDANAATTNPVPGWKPGDPSPNGEASRFANWYMDKLTEFQNWQIAQVRAGYGGKIMVLYPSWGIRPTQLAAAIAVNLNGTTSAETNGEIQRGFDWGRNIPAITDPNVVITSTWLNPNPAWYNDSGTDQRYWSPIKFLSHLANQRGLQKFGENTGADYLADMIQSADLVVANGLLGMLWYREDELFSGNYATLQDYTNVINSH